MLLKELHDDDMSGDMENPLPVPPQPQLGQILDTIDDIEGEYIKKTVQEKRAAGEKVDYRRDVSNITAEVRQKLGRVQEVPIKDLKGIEPKLYSEHLIKLAQGGGSGKLPIVYVIGSGMYVGDGNHRVVNELANGKDTVKVLLIDFRADEKNLT